MEAKKDTPPAAPLNIPFAQGRVAAALNFVVTYNGPGSWKRDAFWDEYVVTVSNPGSRPVTLAAAELTDVSGAVHPAGSDPWELESESKTLEEKYRAAGFAFVRYTGPGLLMAGAAATEVLAGGIFSTGAAAAATATLIAIPVYYVGVVAINHHNKVAMQAEFDRRRLAFPLPLAPGQTRTASLFFPTMAGPRRLALHWADDTGSGDVFLSLDFLRNLHLKEGPPTDAEKNTPPKPRPTP